MTIWTPERIEHLRAIWPFMSQSKAAAELGVTRSAIAGIVSRLGLQKKPSHKSPTLMNGKKTPQEKVVLPPDDSVAFADLGAGQCRYPYNSIRSALFRCCGRPAQGAYCPEHRALCYEPVKVHADRYADKYVRMVREGERG